MLSQTHNYCGQECCLKKKQNNNNEPQISNRAAENELLKLAEWDLKNN